MIKWRSNIAHTNTYIIWLQTTKGNTAKLQHRTAVVTFILTLVCCSNNPEACYYHTKTAQHTLNDNILQPQTFTTSVIDVATPHAVALMAPMLAGHTDAAGTWVLQHQATQQDFHAMEAVLLERLRKNGHMQDH